MCASAGPTDNWPASSWTTGAIPRNTPRFSPNMERSSRTTTTISCCSTTAACNGWKPASWTRRSSCSIVLFDRHAFDLSKFGTGGPLQPTVYSARERSLGALLNPDPNDRLLKNQPGQLFAELHDRIAAALYPFVFVPMAFAIIGAPRTSRQSRAPSLALTVLGITCLRLIGFAAVVFAVHSPVAILILYGSLIGTMGWAVFTISRGAVFVPPAFVNVAITAVTERLGRRLVPYMSGTST